MRIALLADIHSNLEALTACLAHARRQGAERFVFLGDLVGYNADPRACLDTIAELLGSGGLAVCGNHDAACLGGLLEHMSFPARDAIYWTRGQLDDSQRGFLAGLPLTARDGDVLYVHASAYRPQHWIYISSRYDAEQALAATDAAAVFVGHVHEPMLYLTTATGVRAFRPVPGVPIPLSPRRRWLGIVGSVGQPRDGNNAACYAILDRGAGTFTSWRVPYDHHAAAAKILAAGLPERLAWRLEAGH